MTVSGFDRQIWRNMLRGMYCSLDALVRGDKDGDFATFANDMALLLKWRETKDSESWERSFQGFATSWVSVAGESQRTGVDEVKMEAFSSWFGQLYDGFLELEAEEREQFQNWLSLGAQLPSIVLPFTELPSKSSVELPSEPQMPGNAKSSDVAC